MDSVHSFLCQLVGGCSLLSPFAVGADGLPLGDGVGSSGGSIFGLLPLFWVAFLGSLLGLTFLLLLLLLSLHWLLLLSVVLLLSPPQLAPPVTPALPPVSFAPLIPPFAPPVVAHASAASFAPLSFPLAPPVAPLWFPISSLLSSAVSSSPLIPSYPSSSVISCFQAPVSSSAFPIVSSCSLPTVICWALPTVITYAFPSVVSLAAPVHSFISPMVSVGSLASSSSLNPPVTSLLCVVSASGSFNKHSLNDLY